MPHKPKTYKLGRPTGQRNALFRSLVRSVVLHERIKTTLPKAKAAHSLVESLITYGKKALMVLEEADTPPNRARALHYRRLAYAFLQDDEVIRKVFDDLAKRYKERTGGYTRIMRVGYRQGDAAPMALLELI